MLVWSELPSLSQSYTWSVKAMLTLSQLRSLGQSYARLVRATLAQSEIHLVRAMLTYYDTFSNSRDNPNYIKYYMNITRTFLLGIIPFIALLYFNIKIYQRFRQTRNRYTRQKNNNRCRQAKDLQLALILVLVVCMFFVTNLPRLNEIYPLKFSPLNFCPQSTLPTGILHTGIFPEIWTGNLPEGIFPEILIGNLPEVFFPEILIGNLPAGISPPGVLGKLRKKKKK